ncbi:membrane protein [Mycobacterium phage Eaglepride]|nr:membrane protein [Mycobacterium phage Eaglepride]
MKAWVIAALVAAAFTLLGLVTATPASAGPLCEHRGIAHVERYGGLAKDSADHIARGELPTCDPYAEQSRETKASHDDDNDRDRDRKSRFCRKRWWC